MNTFWDLGKWTLCPRLVHPLWKCNWTRCLGLRDLLNTKKAKRTCDRQFRQTSSHFQQQVLLLRSWTLGNIGCFATEIFQCCSAVLFVSSLSSRPTWSLKLLCFAEPVWHKLQRSLMQEAGSPTSGWLPSPSRCQRSQKASLIMNKNRQPPYPCLSRRD